ncbi:MULTISPECIES: protein-disulfide reductase DsbD N-terminal domain-containing protein [Pseudomonadota]|uniref:protein-disulfide reductase DsbD N-terminal domain-containing protein n=1 Tax=Pseudomonadota TaxID=1224 RepID=UPI00084748EC|nr:MULTISPECIES: protein-disulfide reductase DsbD N-terminal domain-containing protein [Pseudomonadota]MDA8259663.1 protein-disulfide reductase DsbD N-terminal domain-containing protein [Betaproteobacteria bacterium]TNY01587.1 cytochrome C biogenesis protein [Stenotrophomonas maltophilia]MCA8495695.1 protein-disulfide reductase DsbD N-terminal domain-containing protein [Burkholderia arboris]RUE38642.1 cytochrome C biogenesis protein [Pseudomonas aeruginosa]TPD80316.1 cytochrome C biogenesis pr
MTQTTTKLTLHAFLLVLLPLAGTSIGWAAEPLPPDQAFKLKVSVRGPNTVIAELVPAPEHYLYKSKVSFALKNASGVMIRQVQLPVGEAKNDPNFGPMEVYRKPIQAEIALDRTPKAKTLTLLARYQGCNEKLGVCYPPIDKSVDLVLP